MHFLGLTFTAPATFSEFDISSYVNVRQALINWAFTYSLLRISQNYDTWRALGPCGLPPTFRGYLFQCYLKLTQARSDTRSTACYDGEKAWEECGGEASSGCRAWLSGLGELELELPVRRGERPVIEPFVVPQRQRDGGLGEGALKEKLVFLLDLLHIQNPHLLTLTTSLLEKHNPALFLHPAIPPQRWQKALNREIAHVHLDADCSTHVCLSLPDAKTVVERGWGERHQLSGGFVPLGYTLIYAPRDEEEVQVLGQILRAAVRALSGGGEGGRGWGMED